MVVYVSQGAAAPAGKVAVPNVIGKPWAEAEKILTAAGFKIISVRQQDVDLVPPGCVLSTTPGPGTQVDPGSDLAVAVRRE